MRDWFWRQKSRRGNESGEIEMLAGKIEQDVSVIGDSAENSNDSFSEVPVQGHVDHQVGDISHWVDGDLLVHGAY